jgi:hypothetical protein
MKYKLSMSEVWEELKKRNVAKAEVSFSGGNDEGGVENIELFDENGKELGTLDEEFLPQKYNEETQEYEPVGEISGNGLLATALSQPVYAKYYSFAGDFHVSGSVVYDVKSRKVNMSGSESVGHDEEFDEEID